LRTRLRFAGVDHETAAAVEILLKKTWGLRSRNLPTRIPPPLFIRYRSKSF